MTEDAVQNHSYERDQVIQIINSVIDKVQHTEESVHGSLYGELKELKKIIDDARQELASERPSDIQEKHIPTATDELDAVVVATEEATGTIMDACDIIQQNLDKLDAAVSEDIESEITKIFEACSFQDITGQRISKVVITLQRIDKKVGRIMEILASKVPGIAEEAEYCPEEEENEEILTGPALPDQAITQNDIDKLLAEFD